MVDKKAKAKQLLVHYLRTIARQAGVNWSPACEDEIEEIVDLIVDAAATETLRCIPSSVLE